MSTQYCLNLKNGTFRLKWKCNKAWPVEQVKSKILQGLKPKFEI